MRRSVGRPRLAEESMQVAFRLPTELVEALDRYVEVLKERTPGLSVTRADAVRMLLSRGLEQDGVSVREVTAEMQEKRGKG